MAPPITDPRPRTPLLLHGRQVPRLLHHHDRLFARPNSRHLPRLLDCALPTNGRKGAFDRGMLVPAEVEHIVRGTRMRREGGGREL